MALKEINNSITAPRGFQAAGVKAGIKQADKADLALVYSETPASAAGMFTTNAFKAPSVALNREKIKNGRAQAIVVNSGNANACTGEKGMQDAISVSKTAAELLNISDDDVLGCSTGIIGQFLPMDKMTSGINQAVKEMSATGGSDATLAIMTTDTRPKSIAYEFELGGVLARVAGMAKGAGMIAPNMATMLAFITTDVAISPAMLQTSLKQAVEKSFNCLTVDGDMSTNDSILALANGQAGNLEISHPGKDLNAFQEAMDAVCMHLTKEIARDGEGATKLVEIRVRGAMSYSEAKVGALTIANSPLVKTAIFGEDPNWGRVLCAVGRSGVRIEPTKTDLFFGCVKIVESGEPLSISAEDAREPMLSDELMITVDLGLGSHEAKVYTCDFSYEYVKINAEYHT